VTKVGGLARPADHCTGPEMMAVRDRNKAS